MKKSFCLLLILALIGFVNNDFYAQKKKRKKNKKVSLKDTSKFPDIVPVVKGCAFVKLSERKNCFFEKTEEFLNEKLVKNVEKLDFYPKTYVISFKVSKNKKIEKVELTQKGEFKNNKKKKNKSSKKKKKAKSEEEDYDEEENEEIYDDESYNESETPPETESEKLAKKLKSSNDEDDAEKQAEYKKLLEKYIYKIPIQTSGMNNSKDKQPSEVVFEYKFSRPKIKKK